MGTIGSLSPTHPWQTQSNPSISNSHGVWSRKSSKTAGMSQQKNDDKAKGIHSAWVPNSSRINRIRNRVRFDCIGSCKRTIRKMKTRGQASCMVGSAVPWLHPWRVDQSYSNASVEDQSLKSIDSTPPYLIRCSGGVLRGFSLRPIFGVIIGVGALSLLGSVVQLKARGSR